MTEPHALLAKAMATLTPEEQGQVLKALLPGPAFGGQDPRWRGDAAVAMAANALGRKEAVRASSRGQEFQQAVGRLAQASLIVRLPPAIHAELKAWSDANGHSMNTVVRGLLEQFLEAQGTTEVAG